MAASLAPFSAPHQRSFSHIESPALGNFWPNLVTWQQANLPPSVVTNQAGFGNNSLTQCRQQCEISHQLGDWQTSVNPDLADSSLTCFSRKSYTRATLPITNYEQLLQTNPPSFGQVELSPPGTAICPFYPMLNVTRPQPMTNRNSRTFEPDQLVGDDPLLTNACLGSYKRKHKRPHIEAQFTMTRSSEQEELVLGQDRLFVRPAGYPPAGQKAGQRRSRPPADLAQVGEIGPAEKIESYLRHCESASSIDQSRLNLEPIDLDELEDKEITFQPYYNLPALKYTIHLPIRKLDNGRLLLEQNEQLQAATRRHRDSTSGSSAPIKRPRANLSPWSSAVGRRKNRSGSSSSCPIAPSADINAPKQCESRFSLDSAQPHCGLKFEIADLSMQPDSLEQTIDRLADVKESSYTSNEGSLCRVHRRPPPVPPHRNQQTGAGRQVSAETGQPGQGDKPQAKRASPDEDSDLSTKSASSSSNGTTTEEVGESLTIDQSVDENYEFDLISSCSSSRLARRQAQPRIVKAVQAPNKSTTLDHGSSDKQQASVRESLVLEKSRFYDVSKQKEQTLRAEMSQHYESVYEVPPRDG